MTNRLTCVLAGLALAAALPGASVLAQQAPAGQLPPRPASPPAAQAPAPAAPQQAQDGTIPIPNATPAHLAAARELVLRSGLSRSFDGAIPDMMRQLNATVTRTRPELTNDMKASLEKLQPEFMKLTEDMIVNAARIYTALLTEQECKDALTFFRSPVGVKFIDLQPTVFTNLSDVMEPWRKHISQRMMDMVRDDMRAKGKPI